MTKHKKYSSTMLALFLLRLSAGGILLYEGFLKIFIHGFTDVATYFEILHFPLPVLVAYVLSFFELIGGLLIIAGVFTRITSLLAALEMAVATLTVNISSGFTAATEVTILMFTIFLLLTLIGGGPFSLERILKLSKFTPFLTVLISIPIVLTLILPLAVFAAGGGGGGGGGGGTPPPPPCTEDTWECNDWALCGLARIQTRVCSLSFNCPTVETPRPEESRLCTPECTEDTWTCTMWSTCSLEGQQTRTCTLTDDCRLIETPKPIELQSCQPECTKDTWECSEWNACSQNGQQTRTCTLLNDCPLTETPRPEEVQSCTPKCTKDTWKCNSWSQCLEDGRERRTCTLVNDCPGITTPKPEQARICPGLRCGYLDTLKKRIACRLKLSNEELAQEFQILYFPEYCKVEESKEEKNECIAFYQAIGPCWKIAPSPERTQCAYAAIGLNPLGQEKEQCLAQSEENRSICIQELKKKVEQQVLFHMYELNVQAEALLERGDLEIDAVTNFETFIETQKQELEKAKTLNEWKKNIQDVKVQWQELVKKLL
ncbi:DoxX family protein [Patescibacteria group bacterium AH-259-L05]|nr:DoxX family protein [Patescibacteria group bacterium AH-259-L05]